MAGRPVRRWAFAAAVGAGFVLLTGLFSRAAGVSLGSALGAGGPDPPVVAQVNGEAVDLGALERVRMVLQANRPGLEDGQAYRLALESLIRHRALVQEAVRQGLEVAPAEVRAHRDQMAAALAAQPQVAQVLADQARANGWDAAARGAAELEAYRQGLLVEKLYSLWFAKNPPSVPSPAGGSPEQGHSAGVLVVMAIPYGSFPQARADFASLRKQAVSLGPGELETAFDALARERRGLDPGEFSHSTFLYSQSSQLPDYARQALRGPAGRSGLFLRRDGTAVLYLVLRTQPPGASARPAAAGHPPQVVAAWAQGLERELLENARVVVFPGRLPPAARDAWDAR